MPTPSNPTPRRDNGDSQRRPSSAPKGAPKGSSSGGRPPRGPSGGPSSGAGTRTLDMSTPRHSPGKAAARTSHDDPGTKRRAQKKVRRRQQNVLAWAIAAVVTVMIGGTAAGIWSEYKSTRGHVGQKQAMLVDLRAQLEIGKKHLRALSTASGKERVLIENGYIKPGERVLLFPKPAPKTGR